ncbi:hypothetical protein R1sor_009480 [Riccia sorocarpa]|uniref:Uncharacterized protein n=1 Tax=Riccia sorocarpa TaxID=122646 RepID=A0ABD3I1D2_9MARC
MVGKHCAWDQVSRRENNLRGGSGIDDMNCRLLGALLLLVLGACWACQQANAQQDYGRENYTCTSVNQSCSSFVLYRTRDQYTSIPRVASLFTVNESRIARVNNLGVQENLYLGQALVIPVTCQCVNRTSMYLLQYVIKSGDTFWLLYNNTFQGLATSQSIIDANLGAVPTDLQIGQLVYIPIRCACPTSLQRRNGTVTLMTYTIQPGDDLNLIGSYFEVPPDEIRAANNLGVDPKIIAQDTLLIPYKVSEPLVSIPAPAPPAPLAVPSPAAAPVPSPPRGSSGSSTSAGTYVGIGVGAAAAVLICAGLCGFLVAKKRKGNRGSDPKDGLGIPQALPVTSSSVETTYAGGEDGKGKQQQAKKGMDLLEGMSDVMDSDKPVVFSLQEIREAIENGHRLQGSVYWGKLRGNVVAIKQTTGSRSEELKILCRVHHTNLIKLVGLCVTEAEDMYLVYEFAENGSLSDCLHTDFLSRNNQSGTRSSSFLSWPVRVQVALDIATGLEYIHDYTNPSYVHKDIKSSNVLLDRGFRAKIANFAMAKSGGSNAMMTRHIAGTYGYMAPEYLAHGLVTSKADVFAFGVILLELLSAQEAILEDENGQEKCLYSCIGPILTGDDQTVKANLRSWIDPVLQGNYPLDVAQQMAGLAKSCLENDPAQRPGMKDITYSLSNLLTASLEWESSGVYSQDMNVPIEAR